MTTEEWSSNIRQEVRFTYFYPEDIEDFLKRDELIITYHSDVLYPYLNHTSLRKNYRNIIQSLSFRDKAEYLNPSEPVGLLMGETIVGVKANEPYEQSFMIEAFTKVLLADKMIWMRLWNYLDSKMLHYNIDQLQQIPLKIYMEP